MPTGVTELDCKPEVARELLEETTQRRLSLFRRERGRQLDQDHVELRTEWLDRAEESIEIRAAIAEPARMGDLAWQLAGEPERRRRAFDPPLHRWLLRRTRESGVHLHGGKVVSVEFEPLFLRQFGRIKTSAPSLEAPPACAEPDLLLVG